MISEKEKFFDPRKPFASKRPETHEEWQARMGGEVLAVVRSGLYLDFRFLDMAFSGIKQLQNALCPFLKYFVFRSLGYTRNAHHLILIRHTKFNRIC